MPYNELLADRVRNVLWEKRVSFEEKKMMGGLCIMVEDKMCVGIIKENLMARVGPEAYGPVLEKAGCSKMDFTGRPLKGYVFVSPEATDKEEDLAYWIQLCLDFNPLAKASKKKKRKKSP